MAAVATGNENQGLVIPRMSFDLILELFYGHNS